MLVIPIVAGLICLVLGLAWLFSVANVFFRDVEHLLAVVVPALVLPHARSCTGSSSSAPPAGTAG